jgi:hypothetical protein
MASSVLAGYHKCCVTWDLAANGMDGWWVMRASATEGVGGWLVEMRGCGRQRWQGRVVGVDGSGLACAADTACAAACDGPRSSAGDQGDVVADYHDRGLRQGDHHRHVIRAALQGRWLLVQRSPCRAAWPGRRAFCSGDPPMALARTYSPAARVSCGPIHTHTPRSDRGCGGHGRHAHSDQQPGPSGRDRWSAALQLL